VAVLVRICAAIEPVHGVPLLHVAAFAWAAAFLGFAALRADANWIQEVVHASTGNQADVTVRVPITPSACFEGCRYFIMEMQYPAAYWFNFP
jgi:hypothetical protein